MARLNINIGTNANDGTGDPLRTAFDKVNDNFIELYTDDAGDVNSVTAGTGISVDQTTGAVTVTNSSPDQLVSLVNGGDIAISGTYPSFSLTNSAPNATHTGEVTGSEALTITDNVISYAKLASEFTTSAALVTNVDFSTAQVFTKTLSGDTTLTFSNTAIGMVKDLVITGDYTLTLPSGSTVAGTYDGTVSNLIQIVVTGASTYWYSISQPQ